MAGCILDYIVDKKVDSARVVTDLLLRINAKHIVDATYGVGRFYKFYRDKIKLLVAVDPNIYTNYVVKPDILIPKPIWAASSIITAMHRQILFDVLVVDPPFRERPRGHDNRLYYYNLVGTPELILEKAVEIAADNRIPYILIHYNKEETTEKLLASNNYTVIKKIHYEYKQGYLNTKSLFYLAAIKVIK